MENDRELDGIANTINALTETAANNHGEAMPTAQPAVVAALLDNLPGIIGGIDWAIRDKCGQPMPFVLLVSTGNGAAHAQNFDAKAANQLIVGFAKAVAESDPDAAALLQDGAEKAAWAMLQEAHDNGQFADDAAWQLPKPAREAIVTLLSRRTKGD